MKKKFIVALQLVGVMALFGAMAILAENVFAGAVLAMAVVGTPTSLSGQNATGLRRVLWERKLYEDSILPSVFTVLESAVKIINNEILVDKAGVFMKILANPQDGQSIKLAMGKPLRKAARFGTGQTMLSNEDERELLWTTLYYNEIKKSVKYKTRGYDYNDTAYLKWIESYGPAIVTFMQELRDTRIHQALLLRRSEELLWAPISLAQQFNPNWIIPNLSDSSFPAWDLTDPTMTDGSADSDGYYSSRTYSGSTSFAENIATALLAASGTGSTPKNLMNIDTLWMISEYASAELRINPLMIDGKPTMVLLVPARVAAWMKNRNKSGSLGEAFENMAEYKDPNRITIPGEIGRVCGNLLIVEDARACTLTVGGSSGAYTLTPGFLWPGDNDDRNKSDWSNTSGSTNYVFDIVIGLGANAIAEYLYDPLVTNLKEHTEYGFIEGKGAYMGSGLQLPFFDKDTAGQADGASKTMVYRGSFIVPIGRVPRVTVV